MAYFKDLTPYEYGGGELKENILNVGWLSINESFPTGDVDVSFIKRLSELVINPVNLYRGSHICEFCPPPRKYINKINGMTMIDPEPGTTGNGEIRIEGSNGILFVAPVLIAHYIEIHNYFPPEKFIDAVMASCESKLL